MKYQLVIKPDAELDILESAKWYEEQREKLGYRFLEAVDSKLRLVEKNPLLYQSRYNHTRFALLARFPFAIHFTVESDRIYVLAVLSTHKNPRLWSG
ncbi:MAG: type II toxin-antitoxin system RelE/ParE family toxin [Cyclobacteriaceae bacterium]